MHFAPRAVPIVIQPPTRAIKRGPKPRVKKQTPPHRRSIKDIIDNDLSDVDEVLKRSARLLRK